MCSDIDDICCCDTVLRAVYIARSHLTELHMHFMAVIYISAEDNNIMMLPTFSIIINHG